MPLQFCEGVGGRLVDFKDKDESQQKRGGEISY